MFVESSRGVCFFQAISPAKVFLCFQDSRQKIGLQNYGWPWQTNPLCFPTRISETTTTSWNCPSFTPKTDAQKVQRIPLTNMCWCHICVFPLRPRLWSKQVHGLRFDERIGTQRSIQRVPMLPEARWPNWCLRCRICPGHLPLDVSCRSRSRCFWEEKLVLTVDNFLNKKTTKNLETAGIYPCFLFGFPKKKKKRKSAMSPTFSTDLWVVTIRFGRSPWRAWGTPHPPSHKSWQSWLPEDDLTDQ